MPATKTVHHIKDGPVSMYEIDARHAVARFPKEWSNEPWPEDSEPQAAVTIPDGWQDLPADERIALAKTVGAKGNIGAAKADAAIEEYLAANPPPTAE